jgi:hypothetical protein
MPRNWRQLLNVVTLHVTSTHIVAVFPQDAEVTIKMLTILKLLAHSTPKPVLNNSEKN